MYRRGTREATSRVTQPASIQIICRQKIDFGTPGSISSYGPLIASVTDQSVVKLKRQSMR